MPMPLLSDEQQRERLSLIMKDTADWVALVIITLPHGDMTVLVSPVPKLRGFEIVSCLPDDPSYDIWKRKKYNPIPPQPGEFPVTIDRTLNLCKPSQSLAQVSDFIRRRTPTEAQFQKFGKEWLEDLFRFYRIPKRAH